MGNGFCPLPAVTVQGGVGGLASRAKRGERIPQHGHVQGMSYLGPLSPSLSPYPLTRLRADCGAF